MELWTLPCRHIQLAIKIKEKQLDFLRLQAQRNELNEAVLRLRDEVKHLIKSSSMVAEVIKVLGKETVLVKTSSEGKLIVIKVRVGQ